MRALIISIFLLASSSIYCSDWEAHWSNAVELCDSKNYAEAEQEFTKAIEYIEIEQDDHHPHVYIDRARLYCMQNKFQEALVDANKGMNSKNLTETDRTRGLLTRMCIYSNLEMIDEFIIDRDEFCKSNKDKPKIEFTDESVIIRNAPKSNCFKKITKAFLIHSNICESEDDIKEYSSGIFIAKRTDLDCECKQRGNPNQKAKEIHDCRWWCDKNRVAADLWCARVFAS